MRRRKRIAVSMLLAAVCLVLSGCWDRLELEDQHFILALGIDERPGGGYVVTVQIAQPNVIAGGSSEKGGGSSGTGAGGVVVAIEGDTIIGSINDLQTASDRRMNLSHVKAIFLGEDLARSGIMPVLSSLSRFPSSRRSVYVLIVRGEAQEFLRHFSPEIESNPGKFVEEMLSSHTLTGLLPRSQMHNILGDLEAPSKDALIGMAAISRTTVENSYLEPGNEPLPAQSDVYAGEQRRVGGTPVEFNGSAMFAGDRLVGLLTGAETRIALMLRGEFRRGFMSFIEPDGKDPVVLDVRRGRNTHVSVTWRDGTPHFTVHVRLEAEILEIESARDWVDPPKSEQLSEAVSAHLDELARAVIAKAQEAGADIFGFGNAIRPAFPTYNTYVEYAWLARFPEVDITPDIQLTIRRTGLLLRPAHPVDGERPAESIDGWTIKPGPPVQQQVPDGDEP